MTTHTHTNAVTFAHSLVLGDLNEVLPSTSADPALTRTITLHPHELDAALTRDAVSSAGQAPS